MKKYLAWLLTIAMVLTLFPATVGTTDSTGENAKDLALLEEEMRQALPPFPPSGASLTWRLSTARYRCLTLCHRRSAGATWKSSDPFLASPM